MVPVVVVVAWTLDGMGTRPTEAGAAVVAPGTVLGGAAVMKLTAGTETVLVMIDVTAVPEMVWVTVCVNAMVVAGWTAVATAGVVMAGMVLPGAVPLVATGVLVAAGVGTRVMVEGTLVQIPGFWGTYLAQMPAR